MRLPLLWLNDYCDPGLPTVELVERLDMTGTQVERVERHGVGDPAGFVVGKVLSAEQHPDADRLRVCSVDVGGGEPQQIVCGAPNVAGGQTVAVALPGAVMPDGTKLGKAKLRGVESAGMILAEDELEIGSDHAGIMVLDDGPVPGTPLAEVLAIADEVLELEITPNRPDCLGVYGVAREVHAATGAPLAPPPWSEDPGAPGEVTAAAVEVECPDLCPRFTARAFENVTIAPSPEWLKARLSAAGQRPISNVVDITNYVMLLTGQPLHAFDLDRVAGARLVVRRAQDGETVTTLDGAERTMDGEMVIICDDDGPTSIAGVMGGERSEVSDSTTRVLMEAATWDGPNIHRTSLRLGLRSEASGRFEKQLEPESTLEALVVSTQLMLELCGATLLPGTIDVGGAPAAGTPIRLRDERVSGLLGEEIPRARCREILEALGFGAEDAQDGLNVTVPAFRRHDVTREADLVEEVGRIEGYERLPATLPKPAGGGGLRPRQLVQRRVEDRLASHGLDEIAGWSFCAPELADRLRLAAEDPRRGLVALANPMSAEQSAMRPVLVGSLLDVARHNLAHGAGSVALFEVGSVYRAGGEGPLPRQPRHVGAVVAGPARRPTWRDPEPGAADFFTAKGIVEGLLASLRVGATFAPSGEPFLHPGRAAAVSTDGVELGWVGEVHPQIAADWDVPGAVGFELDLDRLTEAALAHGGGYRDLTSYPAVRQDLAVVIADDVAAASVIDVVRSAGAPLLEHVEVFDRYIGDQVGAGRVSLALRLTFRAPDRTLTDEEVAATRDQIVAALASELDGGIRA
jgi:phenylalanyl-tRNA synthetase beta chain